MHTFNFCSFKGGTSKTSTSMHIGACLAKYFNKKVLLVDFDSQANLSTGLGVGPDSLKTMVPVLQAQDHIQSVIQETSIPNLHLIAANTYLDGIERTHPLMSDPYSHEYLRRALKEIEDEYDFCFIDTPPSLGWLTQSAFFASEYAVLCVIPEAYSILALRRLKAFIHSITRYHPIEVFGVVLSFWDERGAINKEFIDKINQSFPNKIFSRKIRRDVAVSRAVLKAQTVIEFEEGGRAAQDYKNLTEEFLNRFLTNREILEKQHVQV